MKTINKKNEQLSFLIEMDEGLANAIRRYVNQIPIFAIDEVEISKNDSPLYDETIAHRMGLIPIKMDKTINEKTKLKLSSSEEGIVYSKEFSGGAKPVYENIPITSLAKGQELELVATFKSGKGSEHSKFSPGLMFYRNAVEIKIDKDCSQKVIEACPQKILTIENNKVAVDDEIKCDFCNACVEFCAKHGKDSIKIIPTKELVVTLESFGQLPVEEIFKRAIDALKEDVASVSKKISK